MKQKLLSMLPAAAVVALLALVVSVRSATTSQSIRSFVVGPDYSAEYSTDGQHWYPLTAVDNAPDANDDVLYLRGRFLRDCPEGLPLSFFLNHLFFTMEVNGETVVSYLPDGDGPFPEGDLCGSQWYSVLSPGITTADEVTFTLVDTHSVGSRVAYRDFLKYMFVGRLENVKSYLTPMWQGWRVVGIVLIASGVALLGMTLAAMFANLPLDRWLGRLSIVTLCAGIWLLFDTIDVQLWSDRIVMNTALVLVSRMGVAFGLGLCINVSVEAASPRWQKTARIASGVLGAGTGLLALLVVCNVMTLCGAEPGWSALWTLCGLMMMVCLVAALRQKVTVDAVALSLLLLSWLADLLNTVWLWWPDGVAAKVCMALVLLVEMLVGMQGVFKNYEAASRAMEMERELQSSRMRIALSQIQPHFLYNSLTVIQSLCGIDPAAAENAVNEFAEYLRGNMNSLTQEKPISFSRELDHTRHYLALEQLRFGDQLQVEYDLGPTGFQLPALSLQPLVENAIRHGVRAKTDDAGTVRIVTRETPVFYEAVVIDDGPGFDPSAVPQDGTHVGIANVRHRMQMMCGGELVIESAPGAGTQATLRIPKQAAVPEKSAV